MWFDAYQLVLPRIRTSAPAVVVAIDDASIARHGQWPWPRTLLAELVTRIAAGEPAAIGIDVLMPEPDRLSPARLPALLPGLPPEVAAQLARLPSNDAALAQVLRGKPVVLAVAGLPSAPPGPVPPLRRPPVVLRGGDLTSAVARFESGLSSVETITAAAAGHGLINVIADARVVRRVPLVASVGDGLLPAFGVELLRVASGQTTVGVKRGPGGVESVSIGDLVVPTERDGSVWIRYSPSDPRRFVSATDLLEGGADPRQLAQKLVVVSVTAVGLGDVHATPVAARMAGGEIHAQLLENIFDGTLLSRPRWASWLEVGFLALGGVLLVFQVPRRSAWISVALLGGLAAVTVFAAIALYRSIGVLVNAAYPVVGLVLVFMVMLAGTLMEADRQRRSLQRALQHEREAAARTAGELEAARRIQMGVLPDPARAFPGETRFGVHAFVEPARVVGGDVYDFFRLDDDRVFFLIADVSGKGVSGSLFAAVSKALSKSAALRRHDSVGMIVREANAEISRDNPELLFVTAFAAILDATSGELGYCNAGHEPPFLLPVGGGPPHVLAEGGGPPLCTVDDYPYETARYRMAAGETLCLVTDGVTEATDADGKFYGRRRLLAALARLAPATPVQQIGEAVREDVATFTAGAAAADDLAVLVVRWSGS